MPWINRVMETITVPATRSFFNQITMSVYQSTGYRFHPATFQMVVALFIVFGGYWLYVVHRGAKG